MSASSLIFCVTSLTWSSESTSSSCSTRDLTYVGMKRELLRRTEAKKAGEVTHSVPSGQPAADVDISAHAKVFWLEDLVGRRVGEDGLRVDTGLVGEGTEARDRVVEGDRDLDSLGDEVLELAEHGEVVLGLDVFRVDDVHARDEATEGLQIEDK